MREREAFRAALQTLRQRLRDGAYAPGSSLVIIELAQELKISPTPVREALARLIGEGLVEERKGWGSGVWRVEREACEELYRLHRLQVDDAFSRGHAPGRLNFEGLANRFELSTAPGLRSAAEGVFLAVIQAGCQAWGVAAHRSLADRLAPMRLAEGRLFDDSVAELQALAQVLDRDVEAAKAAIADYHQRRISQVSTLSRLANTVVEGQG